jgi:general secretion pathway protein K
MRINNKSRVVGRQRECGGALLTVLWLSAALAAIAFSLSTTVRTETERAGTALDSLRAYYLSVGAIQRAEVELLWSIINPSERVVPKGATFLDYRYSNGTVHVELIPEAAKLDVNNVPVQDLVRLMVALGAGPGQATELAAAIDDFRRPASGSNDYDAYYLSLVPSFRAPHASLKEIEELLLVKGMTPDIFYGTYVPNDGPGPRLTPRGGLFDCLSVYGSQGQVDANTASPAVLAAVGLPPYAIGALLERRRVAPLTAQELPEFITSLGGNPARLRAEGNTILTIRATARLIQPDGQASDLKRTVAAVMKYFQPGSESAVDVLRWYDNAWSN